VSNKGTENYENFLATEMGFRIRRKNWMESVEEEIHLKAWREEMSKRGGCGRLLTGDNSRWKDFCVHTVRSVGRKASKGRRKLVSDSNTLLRGMWRLGT